MSVAIRKRKSESCSPVEGEPEKRVEELVSDRAYKIVVTPGRV